MPLLSEVVSRRWAEAKAQFESSVRSGSKPGANVDVDAILDEIAKLIKTVGREELESVARAGTPLPPVRVIGGSPGTDPSAMTGDLGTLARDSSPAFSVSPATDQPLGKTPSMDQTGDFSPSSVVEAVAESTASPGKEKDKANRRPPTVAGYEITGVLGRGGMGVVYKATQSGLKRTVALKMILSGEHASPMQIARFSAEARAVALIKHPGIVQIYEIGEHEGLPYFSLEYCPGGSLDKRSKHEPQPPREAAKMVMELSRAMFAAHTAGVIHRDLKPANVLLDGAGVAKITDFGLARELDDQDGQTRTGSVLGTPSYMAPEQAMGKTKEVGPASDQYSLAATLYELLTGRPPFQGSSIMETLEQVVTREPVPLQQLIPTCPKDLETICLKAMQKEQGKRYATCEAFAADLQAFLEGRPISARPVGSVEKAWRWAKRNPRVAGLASLVALLLVVLAAGGTGAAVIFDKKKREAEAARDAESIALAAETQAKLQTVAALEAETKAKQEEEKGYRETRNTVFITVDEIPAILSQAVFARGPEQQVLEALGSMLEKQLAFAKARGLPDRAMLNFHMKMGDLEMRRGRPQVAQKQYEEALAITKRLMESDSREKDKDKGNRALILRKLGNLFREFASNGAAVALARYDEAMKLQREVLEKPETGEIPKAEAMGSLAGTLVDKAELYRKTSEFKLALPPAEEALKLWQAIEKEPQTPYTAGTAFNMAETIVLLGKLQASLGNDVEAEKHLADALARHRKLLAASPKNSNQQGITARAAREYGDFLLMRNETALATEPHELDLALSRGLFMAPEIIAAQYDLGEVYYRSATLALKKGNRPLSDSLFKKCLDQRTLVSETRAELKLPDVRKPYYMANAQARAGQHEAAFKAMDSFADSKQISFIPRFHVRQCAFNIALCVGAVQAGRPDDKLTDAEKKLRDKYADRALDLLEELVSKYGYADVVQLKTDPDLDDVRELPRFKKLVAALEAKMKK